MKGHSIDDWAVSQRRRSIAARRARERKEHLTVGLILLNTIIATVLYFQVPPASHIEAAAPQPAPAAAPEEPAQPPAEPPAPPPPTTKTVLATITAYTSSPEETDSTPFIMASGKHVYPGAAACPVSFEFGEKVVIDGKTYTCEDRMNARYQHASRFDIWMSSKSAAIRFGKQKLEVEIQL